MGVKVVNVWVKTHLKLFRAFIYSSSYTHSNFQYLGKGVYVRYKNKRTLFTSLNTGSIRLNDNNTSRKWLKYHNKIAQKLISKTKFQSMLLRNSEYLSALELYKNKDMVIHWNDDDEFFHDISSLQYSKDDHLRIIFDHIVCSAYLISLACSVRMLNFDPLETEIEIAVKNNISDDSISLAKKLKRQLIMDYDGIFPYRDLERLLDGVIDRTLNKLSHPTRGLLVGIYFDNVPEILDMKLSPSTKNKLVIREIALTARQFISFPRAKDNRFPSDVICELLPMFGINLTKRQIDNILSEYDETKISEVIDNKPDENKVNYFRPLNTRIIAQTRYISKHHRVPKLTEI